MPIPRKSGRRIRRRRSRKWILVVLLVVVVGGAAGAYGLRRYLRRDPGRGLREETLSAANALAEGDFDKARILYSRLVAKAPNDLRLRQNLLVCLIRQGRLDEAETAAYAALDVDSSFAPGHAVLALAAARTGDLAGAVEQARRATRGRDVQKGARYSLALYLLQAGRETEGVRILTQAVEEGDGGEPAALHLATVIADLEEDSPSAIRARRSLGAAIDSTRETLELDPSDTEAAVRLARLAMVDGKPGQAASLLIGIRIHRELTPEERVLLARAHAEAGEQKRAEKVLEGISAGDAPVRETAATQLTLGRPDRALETLETGLAEHPADPDLLRLKLAAIWQRLLGGDPEAVLHLVETADTLIALRPQDEVGLRMRAVGRLFSGDSEGGLTDAIALHQIAPDSRRAKWTLGLALMECGHARSGLMLLEEGGAGAGEETDSFTVVFIARAAIAARDLPRIEKLLPRLQGPAALGLRACAAVLQGDAADAAKMAESPEFDAVPASDRLAAASLLAQAGHPALALRLLAKATPKTAWNWVQVGQLHSDLGREDEANQAYARAVEIGGPGAHRVLLRRGEIAIAAKDEAGLAKCVADLKAMPEGAFPARLLEGRAALVAKDSAAARKQAADALALRPGHPLALSLRFEALAMGDAPEEELQQAAAELLTVMPGHRRARLVSADAMLQQVRDHLSRGNFQQAESGASEILEMVPDQEGARFLRGVLRTGLGDIAAAEEEVRVLMEDPEGMGRGRFLLGLVRVAQGKHDEAFECFLDAEKEFPQLPDPIYLQATTLIRMRRFEEALAAADRLEKFEDVGPRAVSIRVAALSGLRRHAEAEQVVRKQLGSGGDDLAARLLLARLLVLQRKPEEAVRELRVTIRRAPDSTPAYALLITALVTIDQKDEALAAARALLDREKGRVPGLVLQGGVLESMGKMGEAENSLREAVDESPKNATIRLFLGSFLARRGERLSARAQLEEAIALAPRWTFPRLRLAMLHEAQGRVRESSLLYEHILEQEPGNHVAANNLAYALAAEPETAERGVTLARGAVKAAPQFAQFRDTLAWCLSHAGYHEEAVQEADASLGLEPKNADLHYRAAQVYHRAGKAQKAETAAAKAMEMGTPAQQEVFKKDLKPLGLLPR